MLHGDPLTRAQALPIRRDIFVDEDSLHSDIIAHIRVSAALLRLLGRPIHETDFVGVFARVRRDALAFESSEHIVGTVIFVEVFAVSVDRVAIVVDAVLCRLQPVTSIDYGTGFGPFGFEICEDAVLDESYTQVAKFLIYPVTGKQRQVQLPVVYYVRSVGGQICTEVVMSYKRQLHSPLRLDKIPSQDRCPCQT